MVGSFLFFYETTKILKCHTLHTAHCHFWRRNIWFAYGINTQWFALCNSEFWLFWGTWHCMICCSHFWPVHFACVFSSFHIWFGVVFFGIFRKHFHTWTKHAAHTDSSLINKNICDCMYMSLSRNRTHNCPAVFNADGNLLPCNLSSFRARTHTHSHLIQ